MRWVNDAKNFHESSSTRYAGPMTTGPVVLAIDIGGSGVRCGIAPVDGPSTTARAVVGVAVADVASAILAAVEHALQAAPARLDVRGVAVGSRGASSLLQDADAVASRVSALVQGAPVTIAADVVTAHLAVLGGRPGAVLAVGTGAIAIGADGSGGLTRAGGWGPLYDDLGSGFWIGARAMSFAARAHDGIAQDVDAGGVLRAAHERFGPVPAWPQAIYPHEDRVARIASFAEVVAELADGGDPAAVRVISHAAAHGARTLAACLVGEVPPEVGATGGVARGAVFREELARHLSVRRPDARWVGDPAAEPLEGAVILARRTAAGEVRDAPGLVWVGRAPA